MDSIDDFYRAYGALRDIDLACLGIEDASAYLECDTKRRGVLRASSFIRGVFRFNALGLWRNSGRSIDGIWQLAVDVACQQRPYRDFVGAFFQSDLKTLPYRDACRGPLIFVAAVFHAQLRIADAQGSEGVRWQHIFGAILDASGTKAARLFLDASPSTKSLRAAAGVFYDELNFDSKIQCHEALEGARARRTVAGREVKPEPHCEGDDCDIRRQLYEKLRDQSGRKGFGTERVLMRICLSAMLVSSLVLCGAAALANASFLTRILWIVLAFPVLLELALWLGEQVASKKAGPYNSLGIDLVQSGVTEKMWVVVPVLLHSAAQMERLEQTLLSNIKSVNDDSVKFVVLTDLPDSSSAPSISDDEAWVALLEEMVERLNATIGEEYGRPVHFAHRIRTYVSKEKCWMGRGRKLGKLDLFHEAVLEGGKGFAWTSTGFYSEIEGSRLVFVCDEDSQIGRNCLQRLAGVLLHPFNSPRVENGSIKSGHAMAVPALHIPSSVAESWRLRPLTVGGVVAPGSTPPRMTDARQDAFGQCLYSGKGLYDLRVYRQVCPRTIKDVALSHDTIESFSLRPTYVGDAALLEGFPESVDSRERREERWARGDFQNALSMVTRSPAAIFEKLTPLAKYTLARQVLSWAVAWATFPLALVSICFGANVAQSLLGLSVVFIPGVVRIAWRFLWDVLVVGRPYPLATLLSTFGIALSFSALSIWRSPIAFVRLTVAFARAVSSTCTGERRLRWRTSSQAEAGSAKSSKSGMLSVAALTISWAIAWAFAGEIRPQQVLMTLPWILLPFESSWLNRKSDVYKHSI